MRDAQLLNQAPVRTVVIKYELDLLLGPCDGSCPLKLLERAPARNSRMHLVHLREHHDSRGCLANHLVVNVCALEQLWLPEVELRKRLEARFLRGEGHFTVLKHLKRWHDNTSRGQAGLPKLSRP